MTAELKDVVALYRRVSTDEQARDGISLPDQRDRELAYCKANRLTSRLIAYADEGISASVPLEDRPQGGLLMQRVREGVVAHVIAVKLDRLFRDVRDALATIQEWDDMGVTLHLLDFGGQAFNSKSAVGRLMFTMSAAFAEFERNLGRERTKSAMQHKKANGDRLGATPLGYVTPAPGKPMEPAKEELATVALIIKLRERDARRWSFRKIAARLEAEGHKTKHGGKWAPETVSRVWDRRAQYRPIL